MARKPDTVYLRIPEELQLRLKAWSRETGWKMTDLSCEFLRHGMDSPPDALRELRDLKRQLNERDEPAELVS